MTESGNIKKLYPNNLNDASVKEIGILCHYLTVGGKGQT